MILLGTHNSLSYLPCQWYLKLFNWIGKCQNYDLEKQYALGVRYFDIRVKYINDMSLSGHGLLTYKFNVEYALSYLNNYNDCVVRLFLENSKLHPTKHFERFKNDIQKWQQKYTNIIFVEGGCRFNYQKFIPDNESIHIQNRYWDKTKTIIPYPKWWAKRNNPINHKYDNTYEYSIYDFIEY